MSRLGWMALGMVLVAASAGCGYPTFTFDGGDGGGGRGGTTHTGTTSGGGGPSCASVDDSAGCCGTNGALYFCDTNGSLVEEQCSDGLVCGWDDASEYYNCVPAPGGPDPLGIFPEACGQ